MEGNPGVGSGGVVASHSGYGLPVLRSVRCSTIGSVEIDSVAFGWVWFDVVHFDSVRPCRLGSTRVGSGRLGGSHYFLGSYL